MKTKMMMASLALAAAVNGQQPAGAPPSADPTAGREKPGAGANAPVSGVPLSVNSFGGGGSVGGMGGRGSYGTRLSSVVNRAGGSQNAGTVAIFDSRPQKELDELSEDLNVLAHIVSRNLERSLGDKPTEYRMGVPILLDGRLVQARYLEGFGVLATVNVPFPVVSSGDVEKKAETAPAVSDWERVKASFLGWGHVSANSQRASSDPLRYDERLVTAVKKQMLDVLRNGANIRHVKSDEWIGVIVYGGANSGEGADAGRGTILTMRVKKAAADANTGAVTEKFEKEAQVSAYFGATVATTSNPYMGGYGGGYGSVGFTSAPGSLGR